MVVHVRRDIDPHADLIARVGARKMYAVDVGDSDIDVRVRILSSLEIRSRFQFPSRKSKLKPTILLSKAAWWSLTAKGLT